MAKHHRSAVQLLESLGATVSAHQSLASALAAMETAIEAPSLLITDQQIGPGTNATTVIDATIRHFGQTIPALVITGNTALIFCHSCRIMLMCCSNRWGQTH